MSRKEVKAIINGVEETLLGFEAELYLLHGEIAVINRRKYINQSNDFLKSSYKDIAKQQFLPNNEKEEFTADILYDKHY